jgi:hypothetical protein
MLVVTVAIIRVEELDAMTTLVPTGFGIHGE